MTNLVNSVGMLSIATARRASCPILLAQSRLKTIPVNFLWENAAMPLDGLSTCPADRTLRFLN